MPKPTPAQLEQINKFAMEPLTEDQVYVFSDLMIDDQLTAYSSKLHPSLLQKFVQDSRRGVGLLMNHNNRSLPVGRSFDAEMKVEIDGEGNTFQTVYGSFYVDLGRQTESGMATDDIVKGINAGTIFDTSIGFNADKWDCSICAHDIRDYMNCAHIPGRTYEIEGEDGVYRQQDCHVIAGSDGAGELLENSLVYAGAVDRATIVRNFSRESVRDTKEKSNLHLVDDFKNVPVNATIYQYFAKDGAVFFTDTEERTDGLKQLEKRSENKVELGQIKEVLGKFSVAFETPEELETALSQVREQAAAELTVKTEEAAAFATKVEELEGQLSTKDEAIQELTQKNEELAEQAELATTYRQDLTVKALELGVRAQGNAFQKGMYEKFLGTLSIDEIKEVISGFETEVNERFAGARHSEPQGEAQRFAAPAEPQTAEDFESEEEFRAKVADEAVTYAAEHNVSFKEASKIVFNQYMAGGEK